MSSPADPLRERALRLGLHGLLAHWDEVAAEPWLSTLFDWEEVERLCKSLERRLRAARIGPCRPMAEFDWSWPRKIDREAVEDLFTFEFVAEAANVVILGPNGIGKTMIGQNLAHEALRRGHTALFTTASRMLNDLAAQETAGALSRCIQRYCRPRLLVIDEVGYLSYDNRHADLLFEVVTGRHLQKSIVLTTNKPFAEWGGVFSSAGCVVTLVDRLVQRSEIVTIEGDSYRLKEAKERAAAKAKQRTSARRVRRGA